MEQFHEVKHLKDVNSIHTNRLHSRKIQRIHLETIEYSDCKTKHWPLFLSMLRVQIYCFLYCHHCFPNMRELKHQLQLNLRCIWVNKYS